MHQDQVSMLKVSGISNQIDVNTSEENVAPAIAATDGFL